MYTSLKLAHMLFIIVSILLFEYRFARKVLKKPVSNWLKVVPHINDTLLLMTGIGLALIAGFKPWEQTWLGYKLLALVLYVGFGMLALKTKHMKSIIGYILATAIFVFMIFTAISKTPLFFKN